MAKIIKENSVGCWIDGSHRSAEDLCKDIIYAMNQLIERTFNNFSLLFSLDDNEEFLHEIAEDAISFVNWQICGNGDYSESPELIFEIDDNSLFLTKATQEN